MVETRYQVYQVQQSLHLPQTHILRRITILERLSFRFSKQNWSPSVRALVTFHEFTTCLEQNAEVPLSMSQNNPSSIQFPHHFPGSQVSTKIPTWKISGGCRIKKEEETSLNSCSCRRNNFEDSFGKLILSDDPKHQNAVPKWTAAQTAPASMYTRAQINTTFNALKVTLSSFYI